MSLCHICSAPEHVSQVRVDVCGSIDGCHKCHVECSTVVDLLVPGWHYYYMVVVLVAAAV